MSHTPNKPKDGKQVSTPALPHIRSERYTEFYVNHSETSLSPWDCRLKFGQVVEDDRGKPVIEDRAIVVLSLHHAKALALALSQSVALYEQANGQLSIPALAKPEGEIMTNPTSTE